MDAFLETSEFIDVTHPLVQAKAAALASGAAGESEVVRRCFEFVRDHIEHSWDFQRNPVTCKASDVLLHGTGYCYAKSHLLAALLRANRVPAALCYQRLAVGTEGPPFCLHGLNAVFLGDHGWYRLDARGNKPGVQAGFTPPVEQLAFPILHALEADLPGRHARPLDVVIDVLMRYKTVAEVHANLPDRHIYLAEMNGDSATYTPEP